MFTHYWFLFPHMHLIWLAHLGMFGNGDTYELADKPYSYKLKRQTKPPKCHSQERETKNQTTQKTSMRIVHHPFSYHDTEALWQQHFIAIQTRDSNKNYDGNNSYPSLSFYPWYSHIPPLPTQKSPTVGNICYCTLQFLTTSSLLLPNRKTLEFLFLTKSLRIRFRLGTMWLIYFTLGLFGKH